MPWTLWNRVAVVPVEEDWDDPSWLDHVPPLEDTEQMRLGWHCGCRGAERSACDVGGVAGGCDRFARRGRSLRPATCCRVSCGGHWRTGCCRGQGSRRWPGCGPGWPGRCWCSTRRVRGRGMGPVARIGGWWCPRTGRACRRCGRCSRRRMPPRRISGCVSWLAGWAAKIHGGWTLRILQCRARSPAVVLHPRAAGPAAPAARCRVGSRRWPAAPPR